MIQRCSSCSNVTWEIVDHQIGHTPSMCRTVYKCKSCGKTHYSVHNLVLDPYAKHPELLKKFIIIPNRISYNLTYPLYKDNYGDTCIIYDQRRFYLGSPFKNHMEITYTIAKYLVNKKEKNDERR